jgi:acetyl esterase
MALDPESQRLLDLMAAANRPAWITLTPEQAREQYLSTRAGAQGPRPDGVTVIDRASRADRTDRCGSIARSRRGRAELPALVYAHGGGWVFGNLDSHDVLCAQLAHRGRHRGVRDRLSPGARRRLPGAFDDVVAACNGSRPTAPQSASIQPAGDRRRQRRRQPRAPPRDLGARHSGPKLRCRCSPIRHRRGRAPSPTACSPTATAQCADHGMVLRPLHAGQGAREDWRISPLRAKSLAGLPPALV